MAITFNTIQYNQKEYWWRVTGSRWGRTLHITLSRDINNWPPLVKIPIPAVPTLTEVIEQIERFEKTLNTNA